MGRFSDIVGETIEERFIDFVNNGNYLLEVTKEGFVQCLAREDIPGADEIVKISLEQRNHYISNACLLGIEFLYQKDPIEVLTLSDEVLLSVVSFYLVATQESTPQWLYCLVEKKTNVVAEAVLKSIGTLRLA